MMYLAVRLLGLGGRRAADHAILPTAFSGERRNQKPAQQRQSQPGSECAHTFSFCGRNDRPVLGILSSPGPAGPSRRPDPDVYRKRRQCVVSANSRASGPSARFDDGQLPELSIKVRTLDAQRLRRIAHPAVMLSDDRRDVVPLEPEPGLAQGRAS